MGEGEGPIRKAWLHFLWLVWDYQPDEPEDDESRSLGKAFSLLGAGILLSAALARHFGGLCDQTPIYLTILIPVTTLVVALMMVKRGAVLVLILLIGVGSILLVFKIATGAKDSLYPAALSSGEGLSKGLVVKIETYSATDTEYYSSEVRGWRVYFRYLVDGTSYNQCDILSESDVKASDIKVGDDLRVLYLTGRPQIARLLKTDEDSSDGDKPQ